MEGMNGDTFVDILDDRRKTKDFYWANKPWEAPLCRYSKHRLPNEIKQSVLTSARIKNVIKEISKEKACPEEEIEAEAQTILDETSHNFQTGTIRFFGYTLSKFMKRVYGKILVNKKGTEKLRGIASQYPVIYLPTHRSYADFLLVSYVCFYFNLPVPVIAAGLGKISDFDIKNK
jgi:glycerone phosphate O-acyltransferase